MLARLASGARRLSTNPTRHPVAWRDPEYYDEGDLERELRRAFDICHGCRRCYSLCNSFPRLFDLVDSAPSGELDSVPSSEFKAVVDDCTLCDMCFLTKCPYVPPHSFNLDFPRLMLRYRAVENKAANAAQIAEASDGSHAPSTGFTRGAVGGVVDERPLKVNEGVSRALDLAAPDRIAVTLSETDTLGALGSSPAAPIANAVMQRSSALTRGLAEAALGISRDAELPPYQSRRQRLSAQDVPAPNPEAPAFGKGLKVVLFGTCLAEYHEASLGTAAAKVLAHNGIEVKSVYAGCCGMPQMEQGNLAAVSNRGETIAAKLLPLIEQGYEVVTPVASCSLMLKSEYVALNAGNERLQKLADHTHDASEYLVQVADEHGLAPLPDTAGPMDPILLHHACHARAQNMGNKSLQVLRRMLPKTQKIKVSERCSGHGGIWGCKKGNFEVAKKVGGAVGRAAKKAGCVVSDCPLAAMHVMQIRGDDKVDWGEVHPLQIVAKGL